MELSVAADKMPGGLVDWVSAPVKGSTARKRASSEAEVSLIIAFGAQAVKLSETDYEFAKKAIENYSNIAIRRFRIKAVVWKVLESLKNELPG